MLRILTLLLTIPLVALGDGALRLLATTPQVAETLFQIGLGEEVCAVAEGSRYPKAAEGKPVYGTLLSPNLEAALAFRPNWVVFDSAVPVPEFEFQLRQRGIQTWTMEYITVTGLLKSSRSFLERLGKSTSEVQALEKLHQSIPARPGRIPYLFVIWPDPAFVLGPGTFLHDLIARIGGVNQVPNSWKINFPGVAEDWVTLHPPRVLLYLEAGFGETSLVAAKQQKWWKNRSVKTIPLSSETFGRNGFNALVHWKELAGAFDD